ncbi:DNA repair protein RecN, partial [Candidatus Fermentibacterales bacterium]|nr:DNA repair protein RecN [Candidatus Fermentibacterales bacterium]
PPGPLSEIASGGELSRASLALRLALAEVSQPATMVFDEIDSGVGGETAHLLAEALSRASSGGRQVVVVTHLAQIACRASRHLSVSKGLRDGLPVTEVQALEGSGRVEELARVLGGGPAAMEHAKALLNGRPR